MPEQINALSIAHKFISENVRPGGLCIDATAGRGKDTAFLCRLAGKSGRVIAMDIQEDALKSTSELLKSEGLSDIAVLVKDCHSNMGEYAAPETVDCIVFNFGWLPGGNHDIHTGEETSVEAIKQGLRLLRYGGIMSLCVYYGKNNGYGERDAILGYLETLDPKKFTAIVSRFVNRIGDVAFPAFIIKQG